jgi:Flp pilus assembly protein TadD/predicted  nucleic acid-binding Zn-ribbon protein
MLLSSSKQFNHCRPYKLGITGLFCLLIVGTASLLFPLACQAGEWDILPEMDYQQPYIEDEETGKTILLSPNRLRAEDANPHSASTAAADLLALKHTLVKLHTEYEQVVRMNYKLKEVLEQEAIPVKPSSSSLGGNNPAIVAAVSAEKIMALTHELATLKQENQQLQTKVAHFSGTATQWQTTITSQQKMVQALQQKVANLLQENNQLMQKIAAQSSPANTPPSVVSAVVTRQAITAETKQLRETIAQLKVENQTLHQQLNSGLPVGEPAQAHNKLEEATKALKQAFSTIQDQNTRIAGLKEKLDSLQSLQLSHQGEGSAIGLSAIENSHATQELVASDSELQLLHNQLKTYEQTIAQLQAQLQKQASVVIVPSQEQPPPTTAITSISAQVQAAQTAFSQGLKYEKAQNWQKALGFYQQANKHQPEQPYYQLALARALLQQEQTAASLQWLEKLSVQPSIQQEVHALLGKAYLNQQDKTKAISAYQASFKPESFSNYAVLLKQQGGEENLKLAEALMKIAIHLHPTDAKLQYNLGNLYVNIQQPKLAMAAYRQAITLDEKLSKAYYNLGLLEAEQANNTLAKQYFQTYLQLEPNASNKASVQQALSSL